MRDRDRLRQSQSCPPPLDPPPQSRSSSNVPDKYSLLWGNSKDKEGLLGIQKIEFEPGTLELEQNLSQILCSGQQHRQERLLEEKCHALFVGSKN